MARKPASKSLEKSRQRRIDLAKKVKEANAKGHEDAKKNARRKKEIAGAIALKEFAADPQGAFATTLLRLLDNGLRRAADRALFDLPPLPDGLVFIPSKAEI